MSLSLPCGPPRRWKCLTITTVICGNAALSVTGAHATECLTQLQTDNKCRWFIHKSCIQLSILHISGGLTLGQQFRTSRSHLLCGYDPSSRHHVQIIVTVITSCVISGPSHNSQCQTKNITLCKTSSQAVSSVVHRKQSVSNQENNTVYDAMQFLPTNVCKS